MELSFQRKKYLSKSFVALTAFTMLMLGSASKCNALEMGYDSTYAGLYAPSVAAQLGGYTTQLNSYDQAFMNMDMYMLNSREHRKSLRNAQKHISKSSAISDAVNAVTDGGNIWTNAYSTFENVPLKHGPKVSNVSYGQYFGGETDLLELRNGWEGIFGLYAGYNGSHQAYDGMGIYQNGGTLGAVGMAYKDNYFAGLTVNVGANGGIFKEDGDSLNFNMLMTGIAAKTGYNWELANGKFIIQPSYKMSYSYINLFDKKNYFSTDSLNVINIEPGLKFIGNFDSGWQPYAGISMIWNIMDGSATYNTDDDTLTNFSSSKTYIKPYIKYGFGVRKIFGERITGFFQTFFTSGGRNGVGLNLGLSMALGDKPQKSANNYDFSLPTKTKTNINIKNVK